MWQKIAGAAALIGGVYGLVKEASEKFVRNSQSHYESGRLRRNDAVLDLLARNPHARGLLLNAYDRTERYQSERMENLRKAPVTSWLDSLF